MTDNLERQGLIKKLPIDQKKIQDSCDLARRDIKTARSMLASDYDWAYIIAYNAILQAGRALMFSKGYRPDGANQHISVVKFAERYLDKNDTVIFDRMRRKQKQHGLRNRRCNNRERSGVCSRAGRKSCAEN